MQMTQERDRVRRLAKVTTASLLCGAFISACASATLGTYSLDGRRIANPAESTQADFENSETLASSGVEAFEAGRIDDACRDIGSLPTTHAIGVLQWVALKADGHCRANLTASSTESRQIKVMSRLFVVTPGMYGATFSARAFGIREYAEAAAWQRMGLLSAKGGRDYYRGVTLWTDPLLIEDQVSMLPLRDAAAARNPAAQFAVGYRLIRGGPGAEDGLKAGFDSFVAAAEQGFAPAEYLVAEYYYYGRPPVVRDGSRAASWYRRAAEHGYSHAQYSLGALYRTGMGVERDPSEALKWFILAARFDNPLAIRAMNDLASTLPAESISNALQAARDWMERRG